MKKSYVPLEKQSKSAQRAFYSAQRGSWNGVNPVTRKSRSGKQYSRTEFKRGGAEL